ncbi:MAG: ATP-dependent sacrificial sulfur transferase LarE [bacterium]
MPDLPLAKLNRLRDLLVAAGPVAVAFSGGLDSAFVLKVAHDCLGAGAFAITALSPSYASIERERAEQLATEWGIAQYFVHTKELADPRYAANPPSRCYHCKSELFTAMHDWCGNLAPRPTLVDGTTVDDLGDYRPGLKAAEEQGVRHLLVEASLSKAEIRDLARSMDLPIADLPGTACLASRFPYGTVITAAKLARIESAEALVRDLGFHAFRVRDHEPIARLELAPWDIDRALEAPTRRALIEGLKALGFTYVAVDLEGYRTGALNEVLTAEARAGG